MERLDRTRDKENPMLAQTTSLFNLVTPVLLCGFPLIFLVSLVLIIRAIYRNSQASRLASRTTHSRYSQNADGSAYPYGYGMGLSEPWIANRPSGTAHHPNQANPSDGGAHHSHGHHRDSSAFDHHGGRDGTGFGHHTGPTHGHDPGPFTGDSGSHHSSGTGDFGSGGGSLDSGSAGGSDGGSGGGGDGGGGGGGGDGGGGGGGGD
jgi:hypothetical protein